MFSLTIRRNSIKYLQIACRTVGTVLWTNIFSFFINRITLADLEIARLKFLEIISDETHQIYRNKDFTRSNLQNLRMLPDNGLYETFQFKNLLNKPTMGKNSRYYQTLTVGQKTY